MNEQHEQHEQHGDAAAVFDCLKYHASAGGEYEYRGTLALEAFDRICATLLDTKAQRDELLAAAKAYQELSVCYRLNKRPTEKLFDRLETANFAIASAEATPCD